MTTFVYFGNTFTLAPQTTQVLKHLLNIGDISGVEASAMYKVRSLTKRMSEINDALLSASQGFEKIEGQWNKDNTGQRYKRYVMPAYLRESVVAL
jgi:hypothetical protein